MRFDQPPKNLPAEKKQSVEDNPKCPHGKSIKDFCEPCLLECKKNQPAWKRIDQLQKESLIDKRIDPNSPNTEIKIGQETCKIERVMQGTIDGKINPVLKEVQALFVKTFGKGEIDPINVLRQAVDGKTPSGAKDDVIYKVYIIRNSKGELISTVAGGNLDLLDANGKPTGETNFSIAYAVADKNRGPFGLTREAYISVLMDLAIEAQKNGKKLVSAAAEATSTSEKFWNKVGLKRGYLKNNQEEYTEIKYISPALDFDTKTGKPTEGAEEVPEHFMMDSFNDQEVNPEKMIGALKASYRWNNRWSQKDFDSEKAFNQANTYVDKFENDFVKQFNSSSELVYLDPKERKIKRESGIKINDYKEADQ